MFLLLPPPSCCACCCRQVARIYTADLTITQLIEQIQSKAEEMDTMQVGGGGCSAGEGLPSSGGSSSPWLR